MYIYKCNQMKVEKIRKGTYIVIHRLTVLQLFSVAKPPPASNRGRNPTDLTSARYLSPSPSSDGRDAVKFQRFFYMKYTSGTENSICTCRVMHIHTHMDTHIQQKSKNIAVPSEDRTHYCNNFWLPGKAPRLEHLSSDNEDVENPAVNVALTKRVCLLFFQKGQIVS